MLDLEKENNLPQEYTRSYLNFEKGNYLPHKCKESYSNLAKGSNSSRNSQKRLASKTERHSITASARLMLIFQFDWKRSYFREPKGEATQKREDTQKREATPKQIVAIPRRTYFSPKVGLKAKLNSSTKATFTFMYY